MKKSTFLTIAVITASIVGMTLLTSFKASDLKNVNTDFLPQLSAYHIFKGSPQNMVPEAEFHSYTLASTLFTDYAEKQRLIRLPAGTKMTKADEGLPDFPDSTILVKTFYYYNDKRDPTKGRRIIETRLLIKSAGRWNGATYLWNEAQTDAILQKSGLNTSVSWTTADGEKRVISYHIPKSKECATCHNANDQMMPIGFKLRNLNINIDNIQSANQLKTFQDAGILNSFDPHQVASNAQAFNASFPLDARARAYLDINCAHCHNPNGYARRTSLFFTYGMPIDQTGILKKKDKIIDKFQKGKMPLLGTTIVHNEAVQLLKDYINSLN
jgi:uncharacterized repeat protein (TIGR03806 family)